MKNGLGANWGIAVILRPLYKLLAGYAMGSSHVSPGNRCGTPAQTTVAIY